MFIIGIDPGISGSICFFQDGVIQDVIEMPTMIDGKKNKKKVRGNWRIRPGMLLVGKIISNFPKVYIFYNVFVAEKCCIFSYF